MKIYLKSYICYISLLFSVISFIGCFYNSSFSQKSGLRIICNVEDATIIVDEKEYGPVKLYRKRYILLKPGVHRIIITHPQYFTEYFDLKLPKNRRVAIKVNLKEKPY